jgi:hypothetical protein
MWNRYGEWNICPTVTGGEPNPDVLLTSVGSDRNLLFPDRAVFNSQILERASHVWHLCLSNPNF